MLPEPEPYIGTGSRAGLTRLAPGAADTLAAASCLHYAAEHNDSSILASSKTYLRISLMLSHGTWPTVCALP